MYIVILRKIMEMFQRKLIKMSWEKVRIIQLNDDGASVLDKTKFCFQ